MSEGSGRVCTCNQETADGDAIALGVVQHIVTGLRKVREQSEAEPRINVEFSGEFGSKAELAAALRQLADEHDPPVTASAVIESGCECECEPDCEYECDTLIDLDGLGEAMGTEVGAYYAALQAGGVPREDAGQMALDLHFRLWAAALGVGA